MARARVELFEAIRRDHRRDGLSIRELAVRHGVHRRTVRQALDSPFPPPRKPRAFVAPKLDPAKPLIDAMLESDLDAPRKQRHTAKRVWERLVDEYGMSGLSYSTVRDYVSRRRPEIAVAAGRATEAGCVPQAHPPAAEAEVDFADLWIDLCGVRKTSAIASGATCSAAPPADVRAGGGSQAPYDSLPLSVRQLNGCGFEDP